MSLDDLLARGGPVMIPILLLSLVIWWIGLTLALGLRQKQARRRAPTTLRTLRTMTGAAPYLGLLGTVSGMMLAFEGLLRYGPGNLRGLSDGIARALVTTQAGLLVALIGMLFLVYLEAKLRRLEAGDHDPRRVRRGRRRRHA